MLLNGSSSILITIGMLQIGILFKTDVTFEGIEVVTLEGPILTGIAITVSSLYTGLFFADVTH